jgi:hypothetical protein
MSHTAPATSLENDRPQEKALGDLPEKTALRTDLAVLEVIVVGFLFYREEIAIANTY